MNTGKQPVRQTGWGLMLVASLVTLPLAAASFDTDRQARNWETDGLNGGLLATGMLVSAPCVLAPESRQQEVELGTAVISGLKNTGDVTVPVDVHIVLDDCPGGVHRLEDRQDVRGGLWLSDQSTVRMTVTGEADPDDPRFFRVHGTSGVSLRMEDPRGKRLTPGMANSPLPLNQGRNDMVLRAQLWRTAAPLDAGSWQAVVNIGMEYE